MAEDVGASLTPIQIANEVLYRYEADVEFHAAVYRAATIVKQSGNLMGDMFSNALLGAAVALHLAENGS